MNILTLEAKPTPFPKEEHRHTKRHPRKSWLVISEVMMIASENLAIKTSSAKAFGNPIRPAQSSRPDNHRGDFLFYLYYFTDDRQKVVRI